MAPSRSTTPENKPPPPAMLAVMNPLVRATVGTPAWRLFPFPAAVLRFTGRRSGRELKIVANVHDVDGTPTVITTRPWRLNFAGGREVEVTMRGQRRSGTGTLVEDPPQVAAAMNTILAGGLSARELGLAMPDGHVLTDADARALGRAMIRLEVR